jgi:hypothetical protein
MSDIERQHQMNRICLMAAMIYAGGQVPRDQCVASALAIEAAANRELRGYSEGEE